jgi:hypothetical protein
MKSLIAPVLLILSCMIAAAADVAFTSTLTPEERRATGVDALTPAQIAQLDALVQQYKNAEVTREVVKAVKETHESELGLDSRDSGTRIESRLIGTCSGWKKNALFRLENGQVWKVANSDSYYYHTKKLTSPAVLIETAAISGFWLKIEGLPKVRVKRVK